jgi:hypothetical protein
MKAEYFGVLETAKLLSLRLPAVLERIILTEIFYGIMVYDSMNKFMAAHSPT